MSDHDQPTDQHSWSSGYHSELLAKESRRERRREFLKKRGWLIALTTFAVAGIIWGAQHRPRFSPAHGHESDETVPYCVIKAADDFVRHPNIIVVNRKSREVTVFPYAKNAASAYATYPRLDGSALDDYARELAERKARELVDKSNIAYLPPYPDPAEAERAQIQHLIATNKDGTRLDLNRDDIQDVILFDRWNKYTHPYLYLGNKDGSFAYIEHVKLKQNQARELGTNARAALEDVMRDVYGKQLRKPPTK